ncbi:hypothetical protein DEO72_LG10g2537 [Vigna unguiculata]|uniref:Uncharacterized protein n=1 Tax=Vigna unguiculata TaxID=3917 RepID=A0A4D6NF04_VIGUN|nr:hypothetical protein DEO72_LG10g2537 [Vigna unguiculata]
MNFIYMAEHHTSSEDEAPTKRSTRGGTRFRRAKCEKYQSLRHLLIMSLKLIGK